MTTTTYVALIFTQSNLNGYKFTVELAFELCQDTQIRQHIKLQTTQSSKKVHGKSP